MSLELAAQHLASRGRGPDTQLIHMAPQEVAGLHALAKAHGGQLTINPDTGLPEAGFLSSILPMVIGGALTAMSGGALTPMMAGMMTGAGYGLATGSLSKGLVAGMGAFGGAGLAGGLMGAGAAAGVAETGLTATGGVMGANPMIAQPMTFGAETLGSAAGQGAGTAAGITGSAAGLTPPPGVMPSAPAIGPTAQAFTGGTPQVATATPMADRFSQLGQGFKSLGTEAGREAFMGNAASKGVEATGMGGLGGLAKYGMAAASPVMADMMTPKPYQKPAEEKPYEYTYSSGRRENPDEGYTGAQTGERSYFDHRFTRTAAGGGLMDTNSIGAMSQQNQSQMQPAYARGGVSDVAVNPYTGAENFASGGLSGLHERVNKKDNPLRGQVGESGSSFGPSGNTVPMEIYNSQSRTPAPVPPSAVRPVEQDPYNTMTGQSAAMYKYLMGQGPRPTAPGQFPAPGTGMGPVTTLPATPSTLAPSPPKNMLESLVERLTGKSSDSESKRYTFDPATGGFTALAPTAEADFDIPTTTGMWNSGDYGGDSGSAGVGVGVGVGGEGGGMGNSGEGGADAGWAHGGIASLAQGGPSHLGDYSDGGRLLRGPGDGVSDSIPASIGDKRPARLADGEFVVPARIVSELGNGSTEAGARKLYAMMDRVQKARAKTTGKNRVATNTKAERLLPV